jgi:predicted nucleic acid-binding protein
MSNYLLDVNVVVAHAILEHVHHQTVFNWLDRNAQKGASYHVSPIIELGLIRNAMRLGGLSISEARKLLENEIINLQLQKIPDSISANQLPDWVQGYRQTTDAYLSELAKAHQLTLLTIDKGIPNALLILPQ